MLSASSNAGTLNYFSFPNNQLIDIMYAGNNYVKTLVYKKNLNYVVKQFF